MNVGLLNKRITFQERRRAENGAGGFVETYESVFTVWGSFRVLKPQHRQNTGQVGTYTPIWIIVRKSAAMRPKPHMRALEGERVLNVLSVQEYTPDKKYWEIEAQEISP
ncbi:MAG: head-tail adaptor protein [Acidaminococcales bacterium]|nr:head-tail adaptor protein [Acidaminococcales bacterium]